MTTVKPIAVIPARGNSKRVPRKNIVDFNGKPLIHWTIEAALASGAFDEVFVSTDDPEIAEISQQVGASVPFLREAHADDHSTVSQATAWFVDKLKKEKVTPDSESVVQLMANCPLRRSETLNRFVDFSTADSSSVISVVQPKFGSPFWTMTKDHKQRGSFLFEEFATKRSQDLPEHFYPTGSLWYSSIDKLIQTQNFYSDSYRVFEIDWLEAIDIDTLDELDIAKCLHRGIVMDGDGV